LEILRAANAPRPLGSSDLDGPVAALPLTATGALVLDGSGPTWRLRSVDLASGHVIDLATGAGAPSAMAAEAGLPPVLVASYLGDAVTGVWIIQRVIADGTVQTVARADDPGLDPTLDRGAVRGLVSLGQNALVLTAGSSVIRIDAAPSRPAAATRILGPP